MAQSSDCVLVLDLGTSSCKGALYSRDGRRLATEAVEYPLHTPAPHFVEQDPEDYVRAASEVRRRLCSHGHTIRAIGFSTQTPTLVFVDAEGRAAGPAIIWQDSRAAGQAAWLASVPPATRQAWFGMDLPVSAASTPAKLLWVKQNIPALWQATRWVMQPKDYVASVMTGRMAADRWCAKGIAHLHSGEMHPEWMAALGKRESLCPPVLSMRAVIGNSEGIPVTVGWSDAMAAVLATGAMHTDNRGFVLTGTSEIVGVSRRGAEAPPGLFHVPPEVMEVPSLSLHYGPTQAGGSCLTWIAGLLDKTVEETLALLPSRAALSPILFRPYLQGERAPYWDHTLTAAFECLRAEHTAADLVHAVLQGVALHERLVIETAEQGREVSHVVLAGGAARNAFWNQLRADILQRPILVMNDTEASLRGAAMLAWESDADWSEWFAAEALAPDASLLDAAADLYRRFLVKSTRFST
ncbi:MAG: hypothetical protein IT167_12310 [Bryobacterales bacterium]|nr:hypothetical protein [Bryobacterales bacterium]